MKEKWKTSSFWWDHRPGRPAPEDMFAHGGTTFRPKSFPGPTVISKIFSFRSSSSGGFGLGLGGGLLLGYSMGRMSGGYGGYGYGHNYGQYSRGGGYSTERWEGHVRRIT